MKRPTLLIAGLALAAGTSIGFAGDKTPLAPNRAPEFRAEVGAKGHEVAEEALRKYYGPTAHARITSEFEVNGIRVFNATVDRDGAVAEATLTAAGDYISMGIPERLNDLTPGAQETAQLFKAPPVSITREDIHAFYVTVKAPGNSLYTIELDATGRVRDVKTSNEIREDANSQKGGGPQARHVTEVTMQRFAGVQVEGVFAALHDPGYFMVPFRDRDGHGWAIISEANDVAEWRYPEAMGALPEPVRRAVDRDLRGDRIVNIEQGASRIYRIKQNINGEDVVMQVNSAGSVEWISSRELHRAALRQYNPDAMRPR